MRRHGVLELIRGICKSPRAEESRPSLAIPDVYCLETYTSDIRWAVTTIDSISRRYCCERILACYVMLCYVGRSSNGTIEDRLKYLNSRRSEGLMLQ